MDGFFVPGGLGGDVGVEEFGLPVLGPADVQDIGAMEPVVGEDVF